MRFLLTLFVVCFISVSAMAQEARLNINELEDLQRNPGVPREEDQDTKKVMNPYDPKYRPVHQMNMMLDEHSITGARFSVRFVRPDEETEARDTAVLRLSQKLNISGCAAVIAGDPDVLMKGRMMMVTLPDPVIAVQKNKRYAHYECGKYPKEINIDLPVSRQSLQDNNVNTILFRNRFGTDRYNLLVNEHALRIEPRTTMLFEPAVGLYGFDTLTHWFYPENTIIAEVPTARGGEVFWEIEQWAVKRNLVPLDMRFDGFNQPTQNNKMYYVDEVGMTAARLDRDKMSPIGHIVLQQTWYGSNGPYEKGRKIQITAKKPGLYE